MPTMTITNGKVRNPMTGERGGMRHRGGKGREQDKKQEGQDKEEGEGEKEEEGEEGKTIGRRGK